MLSLPRHELSGQGPLGSTGPLGQGRLGVPSGEDVPYWRLYVSWGSSGLVRDLRSKAKPGHKHTLGAPL